MNSVLGGLRGWLVQRATALYMAVFVLIMPFYIVNYEGLDHAGWRALLAEPFMSVTWALFFIAIMAHAWVGVRDIIIDYVHVLAIRVIALSLLALVLCGLLVWGLRILLLNIGAAA